jgi:hypothetical protein
MKYMLLIHQGTTPLPGSPEWVVRQRPADLAGYAEAVARLERPALEEGSTDE